MRSGWQSYKQKIKKRADEIHTVEIQADTEKEKRADEIKIQMAKIEAEKDLTLKEMELKAQDQVPVLQLLHLLSIEMSSPKSYQPL